MTEAQVLRLLILFLGTANVVISTVLAAQEAMALPPAARITLVAGNAGLVFLLGSLKSWSEANRDEESRTRASDRGLPPHG